MARKLRLAVRAARDEGQLITQDDECPLIPPFPPSSSPPPPLILYGLLINVRVSITLPRAVMVKQVMRSCQVA